MSDLKLSGYREYPSVRSFPKHTEKLSREELETHYLNLRTEYKSLVLSRGQLVRRQVESKDRLKILNVNLQKTVRALDIVQQERQKLQESLRYNTDKKSDLQEHSHRLEKEVDTLTARLKATTRLIEEFESVYEDVREDSNILSVGNRFIKLLRAAKRLLTTDLREFMPTPLLPEPTEDWTKEDPASLNKSLLDDR
ncbi:hypothetical protein [Baaleninema simplex]|uniref:hypothetical protein n=1 Tax=Baaleninema simplex TaxID=2862350 RepID=UPI00034B32FF|nr:hypothetical protein [Baaleninema simplex]